MKSSLLSFVLLLAGIVTGCGKPPIVTKHCDLTVNDVCFERTDGKGSVIPYPVSDQQKVTDTIQSRWQCRDRVYPACPQDANCTNADFVAWKDGKIAAYYQDGMWKKPNGKPLEIK